ncbi:MAG TPA: hypothetical protein VK559_08150 [Ferruginibacter sp.]|nr:hypothetical protein [Ferruginibacter sp.]
MKTKKVVKIIFAIYFFVLTCVGILCVYRSTLILKDLTPIEGIVINKNIAYVHSGKGGNYLLEFGLQGNDYIVAISTGYSNINEAESDSTFNKIKLGEVYTFYIDPTIATTSNTYSSVKQIYKDEQCIFKFDSKRDLYGGLGIILLSIGALIFTYKFPIKNKTVI